ncbi:alkaline phosphatase family protein [Vibrio sp. SS-MA-C1-2]|uniref:alkaline phosphatase D family protein n=1 Tax=Vibrio sp. SS-MA-C1-2 TaxID=2908646 RepID=UPI001F275FDD|nr:alkaline phosphatase D family protein [Vibrio sp. SS-MA-C1-2]UJF18276.1 alkaline phosphatase family protein [Vibrio sp. SS-MA-C1-2]
MIKNKQKCNKENSHLPTIICGPLLRKVTNSSITLWLVTSKELEAMVSLYYEGESIAFYTQFVSHQSIQVGQAAWVTLIQLSGEFPENIPLQYQIETSCGDLGALIPDLMYEAESRPTFIIKSDADYVLHGSCRNPHFPGKDSLVTADLKVKTQTISERPSLLMMSGDQIYADHVAGPMLDAIQQVIALLGLYDENFENSEGVQTSQQLYQDSFNFYQREKLLPTFKENSETLSNKLVPKRRAIFTSSECENHLITFGEYFAMYLLVWSPTLWQFIDLDRLEQHEFKCGDTILSEKWQQVYRQEKVIIEEFVAGLPYVRRLMAHIPTYMIFDDHDITDDWNLTAAWEYASYQNLFSRQIITNGLASYWLCQGWGNAPERFDPNFIQQAQNYITHQQIEDKKAFIDLLFRFERWHYTINTHPKIVVLDTRTRRWRSESKMSKPSGLMDWEALIEMQQELLDQDAVIIVSAAPMFGVKFIEMLQKGMTILGQPLLIDAENWMAHPGSANTLLNIFTHTKTPTNFVILSGDVHYSFAYDITLRMNKGQFNIYQITCSGFKNEFPNKLLRVCDFMDRVLYSAYSPLNILTKRKRLLIKKREPSTKNFNRLINRCAIGELYLDKKGKPERVEILTADGESVSFK